MMRLCDIYEGNKIICIRSGHDWFTVGNVYVIGELDRRVTDIYDFDRTGCFIKNDYGERDSWSFTYMLKANYETAFMPSNMLSEREIFHLKMTGRLPNA